jgi:hypothetical protein
MQPIKTYIYHPNKLLLAVLCRFAWALPNKLFLQMRYRLELGRKLDLKNPKRFTEKIQWLKLYNRKAEYTTMVDKYAVKGFVAKKIGEQYIIPTLGVWEHFDDIDFDKLPNRFVLKTTHGGGGGGIVICKDKNNFDKENARIILENSLKHSDWKPYGEWPYKNVPRRIIAEKFISNGYDEELTDFKFYCFNGEPRYCQVIADRHTKETIDFYDMDWKHQGFYGLNPACEPAAKSMAKPAAFETMKEIARMLAKDTLFVRVDLYAVSDTNYFGELTFYPASGFGVFTPDSADFDLGQLLTLKGENRGGYNMLIDSNISISRIDDDLRDYKFYCFNGVPRVCKVDFGRFSEEGHKANFYDMDWNLLDVELNFYPSDKSHFEKCPSNFQQMVAFATQLSKGYSFLRVDLYNLNGVLFFGELTFFPDSGFCKFLPEQWDEKLGELLSIESTIVGGGVNS